MVGYIRLSPSETSSKSSNDSELTLSPLSENSSALLFQENNRHNAHMLDKANVLIAKLEDSANEYTSFKISKINAQIADLDTWFRNSTQPLEKKIEEIQHLNHKDHDIIKHQSKLNQIGAIHYRMFRREEAIAQRKKKIATLQGQVKLLSIEIANLKLKRENKNVIPYAVDDIKQNCLLLEEIVSVISAIDLQDSDTKTAVEMEDITDKDELEDLKTAIESFSDIHTAIELYS
ncbi:hypothetical protein Ddc_01669 [Ditylenchus destructor]|nr:hypothetical protein Ddc_01669 [Ditylenchus destructor]